ncbi:MAG: hypothetical protein ACRDHL_03570 [Candidatus Promineifilaceae bacterium]
MPRLPAGARALATLRGNLYGWLHAATRHRFLGASWAGWLKFAPLALLIAGLLLRWPWPWLLAAGLAAAGVRLLLRQARRVGYIHFLALDESPAGVGRSLAANERVGGLATGLFSLVDREEYLRGRPADYWRGPLGDHAIMAQRQPGRFMYQFIQPGALVRVQPGLLFAGRRPRASLALTFLTNWGPQAADKELTFYTLGPNHSSGALRRTVYLSFASEADRQAVWRNLIGEPWA